MAAGVTGARALPDWVKFKVSNAGSSGDPNSLLSGSPADGTGGFSASILGGIVAPEPHSGAWWTFPATDDYGQPMVGSDDPNWLDDKWALREITAPSLSSDIVISVGLADNANLSAASCTYRGAALTYQGGLRGVRAFGRNGSNAMQAWDDPTPSGDARRVYGSHNHSNTAGKDEQVRVGGYTDAMGLASGDAVTAWISQLLADGASLHWFISIGRLAATAGTESVDFSAFGLCSPRALTYQPV